MVEKGSLRKRNKKALAKEGLKTAVAARVFEFRQRRNNNRQEKDSSPVKAQDDCQFCQASQFKCQKRGGGVGGLVCGE